MSGFEYNISIQELMARVHILEIRGDFKDGRITDVTNDSRKAKSDAVFVCLRGTLRDGHEFIDHAIEQGCRTIILEEFPEELLPGISYVRVQNSRIAYAEMNAALFDDPQAKLRIVGVTGTNGKTTVSTLLYMLFNQMGKAAGLISTINVRTPNRILGSGLTTPNAGELRRYMADMVEDGCQFVFMEVSSHALDQQRTIGLDFDLAIFTNISRDHLDYHGNFKNYLEAKKKLFDHLPEHAIALVNKDDKNGRVMLQNCNARKYTYGIKSLADFKGKILENTLEGLQLRIGDHEVFTRLTGAFNAENLLAAFSAAVLLGMPEEEVLTALSGLAPIEGRMELIVDQTSGLKAIVDYAHSPDALEKLLKTVRSIRDKGRIIVVVGCGGDRDRGKRPQMAQIACSLSDQLIFTSDNPRTEDPMHIIEDMMKGVNEDCTLNLLTIVDRKQAIKTACRLTTKNDVIVVAGKGHETYQEINGVRHRFDDREIIEKEFEAMKTIKK